jgi:SAM-dependent methyltransferase
MQLSFSGTNPILEFGNYVTLRMNERRMEHLASLRLDLAHASVLEVGAGVGNLTSFFVDRGCKVVSTEARPENLKHLAARYPDIQTRLLDLDHPDLTFPDPFDIVFCYGLLYHLKNPAEAIAYMARQCRKLLLLETCVSFGEQEALNAVEEDKGRVSQAVSGTGCRPTRPWVYARLKQHFPFVYSTVTQPSHPMFPLDWSAPAAHKDPLVRTVFIASKTKLDNPFLVEGLPVKQQLS